jgi:hypothetical protein
LLKAVTIAGSPWWGYLNQLLCVNYIPNAVSEIRAAAYGSPFTAGISRWIEANPLYKLPLTTAAVRIETASPASMLGHWEYYALLKEHGRPVDFIYFPQGRHVLMKPSERLASQGGTVDWFDFWLNEHEDTRAEKADQYVRWRKLRAP